MKNWKKLNSSIVHTNPWYRIRKDEVVRPDGSEGEYFVLETNGASVFIVAVNEMGEILLIGQERYTSGIFSWEIPGGNSEGQDPRTAAARELLEETGIEAREWEAIGIGYPMNGVSSEKSHVFRAKNLTFHESNQQAEEGITQMKWVTLDEIKRMIKSGEITDTQTMAAITQTFLS